MHACGEDFFGSEVAGGIEPASLENKPGSDRVVSSQQRCSRVDDIRCAHEQALEDVGKVAHGELCVFMWIVVWLIFVLQAKHAWGGLI